MYNLLERRCWVCAVLTHRQRFVELALSKLDHVVLWEQNGPELFDCSGLVYWALKTAGVELADHSAQMFADETPNLVTLPGALPLSGDLCFYGIDAEHISHVGIWLPVGRVLSADGATSRIRDAAVASAKPGCRVRVHDKANFRADLAYFAVHRNTFVDRADKVTR